MWVIRLIHYQEVLCDDSVRRRCKESNICWLGDRLVSEKMGESGLREQIAAAF